MKLKKRKQVLQGLLFLMVVGIIIYMLRHSMKDILNQLLQTPWPILAGVLFLGVLYQVVEGIGISFLGKVNQVSLTPMTGFQASCYAAFVRVVSFGAGGLVGEVWFYHKKGASTPNSVGISLGRLIFYKLALLFWGILGGIFKGKQLYEKSVPLFWTSIVGLIGTSLLLFVLLFFTLKPALQILVVKIADKMLKKANYRKKFDDFNLKMNALREFFLNLKRQPQWLLKIIFLNFFKVIWWLVIPALILKVEYPQTSFSLFYFLTVWCVLLAGILPTPAGMGSVEFTFLLYFPLWISKLVTIKILLLYRFASYLLPFFMGMMVVLKERLIELKKEKAKEFL